MSWDNEDFFNNLQSNLSGGIDGHLSGHRLGGKESRAVRDAFRPPVEKWASGERVALLDSEEVLFTYPGLPRLPLGGTVVKVKTSSGRTTGTDGRVFVLFDDGPIRHVLCRHVARMKQSRRHKRRFRRVVGNLGDLTDFMRVGGSRDLVHKATRDLWSVSKDGDNYVIERLFEQSGEPLKV